ncbi:hypothetical protein ACPPVO_26180 [Dactylosporangium sp. McL0621]|uniref:hypothetical protein n=1 Tax=Dactylosporangium sp. McL0621 TaxID=3415678 RepID=UPI003CF9493E
MTLRHSLLGPLLGVPEALSGLGPFAQHGWPGLIALAAVAVVTAGAGLAGVARRDLRIG